MPYAHALSYLLATFSDDVFSDNVTGEMLRGMMVVRHLEDGSISFSRRASDEQLENERALSRALSRVV